MPLRVVVLVEGKGEEKGAIRVLLERVWYELLGGDFIEVLPRQEKQGRLLAPGGQGLRRAVQAAAIELHRTPRADCRRLLLVLIDTEGLPENCPKTKAAELLAWARQERSDELTEIACVLPNPMFEVWFAAAAESLRGVNDLPGDLPKEPDPEGRGLGKGWVRRHLPRKYKETVDMARFAAGMSLEECQASSRSFCKLVKVLRERLPAPPQEPPSGTPQPPAAPPE